MSRKNRQERQRGQGGEVATRLNPEGKRESLMIPLPITPTEAEMEVLLTYIFEISDMEADEPVTYATDSSGKVVSFIIPGLLNGEYAALPSFLDDYMIFQMGESETYVNGRSGACRNVRITPDRFRAKPDDIIFELLAAAKKTADAEVR